MTEFARRKMTRIAAALEQWFVAHQRDLPWRRATRSVQQRAYRCLVAECMLHQTQVSRVLQYFNRFIARFATVQALADASEQDVLALWQGLGYYRRARHLHAAAKMIVTAFDGRIPDDVDSLLTLPGVGRYTAGAIASIAFGIKAPIVDGNVQRVVARWIELGDDLSERELEQAVWNAAGRLVAASTNPGDFNQAMMELGSTVCLPRGARCEMCPARKWCGACASDHVELYPPVRRRAEPRTIHAASVIINRGGKVLLCRRPARGLWANMWQCPTLESDEQATMDAIVEFVHREHALRVSLSQSIGAFSHQTSHRRVMFEVWRAEGVRGRACRAPWVALDAINAYPLSNAQRKVLAMGRATPRPASPRGARGQAAPAPAPTAIIPPCRR